MAESVELILEFIQKGKETVSDVVSGLDKLKASTSGVSHSLDEAGKKIETHRKKYSDLAKGIKSSMEEIKTTTVKGVETTVNRTRTVFVDAAEELRKQAEKAAKELAKQAEQAARELAKQERERVKQAAEAAREIAKQAAATEAAYAKLGQMSNKLLIAGGALLAAIAAQIKPSSDFRDALIELSTHLKGTSIDLDLVKNEVRSLSTEFGQSKTNLTAVADRFAIIKYTAEDINKLLPLISRNVYIAGGDLKQVGESYADMASYLNMSSSAFSEIVRLTGVAAKQTGADLGNLVKQMAGAIPISESAGINLKELIATLAVLSTTGVDARQTFDLLTQALRQPTKEAKELFSNLEISIDPSRSILEIMNDVAKSSADAGEMFAVFGARMREHVSTVELFKKVVGKFPEIQAMIANFKDAESALTKFKNMIDEKMSSSTKQLKQSFIDLGETLVGSMVGPLEDVVDLLTGFVNRTNDFIKSLGVIGEILVPFLSTLGTLAVAFGVAGKAIVSVHNSLKALEVIAAAGGGMAQLANVVSLSATVIASSIGVIGAAIAGLQVGKWLGDLTLLSGGYRTLNEDFQILSGAVQKWISVVKEAGLTWNKFISGFMGLDTAQIDERINNEKKYQATVDETIAAIKAGALINDDKNKKNKNAGEDEAKKAQEQLELYMKQAEVQRKAEADKAKNRQIQEAVDEGNHEAFLNAIKREEDAVKSEYDNHLISANQYYDKLLELTKKKGEEEKAYIKKKKESSEKDNDLVTRIKLEFESDESEEQLKDKIKEINNEKSQALLEEEAREDARRAKLLSEEVKSYDKSYANLENKQAKELELFDATTYAELSQMKARGVIEDDVIAYIIQREEELTRFKAQQQDLRTQKERESALLSKQINDEYMAVVEGNSKSNMQKRIAAIENERETEEKAINRSSKTEEEKKDLRAKADKIRDVKVCEEKQKDFEIKTEQTSAYFSKMGSLFDEFYKLSAGRDKKMFRFSQAMRIASAIADTAGGVSKALREPGGYAGIALAALIAAMGGAQIGIIAAQKPPEYAQGGEIKGGSGTRDDVMIATTGGEYVVRKPSVRKYGVAMLDAINRGAFDVPSEWMSRLPTLSHYPKIAYESGGLVMDNKAVSMENSERNLKIVNVVDPSVFSTYLTSSSGQKTILNVVAANKYEMNYILRG